MAYQMSNQVSRAVSVMEKISWGLILFVVLPYLAWLIWPALPTMPPAQIERSIEQIQADRFTAEDGRRMQQQIDDLRRQMKLIGETR